jgi:hypothetical protein
MEIEIPYYGNSGLVWDCTLAPGLVEAPKAVPPLATLGPGADTGRGYGRLIISEAVADASSAAAKNLRRRAPSAGAGGCVGLGCSMAWAAADRPRALP